MQTQRTIFSFVLVSVLMMACLMTIQAGAQPSPVIDAPLASLETGRVILDAAWGVNGTIAVASAGGLVLYDSSLLQLAEVHQGNRIYSIAWSPDESKLALAVSNSIEIWDWDGTDLSLDLAIPYQMNEVLNHMNLEWSPSGQYLASIGLYGYFADWGKIYVLDQTNNWHQTISDPYYFALHIQTNDLLEWKNDSSAIAFIGSSLEEINGELTASSNESIFVVDPTTFSIKYEIETLNATKSLDWSPDDNNLLIGYNAIKVYDLVAGEYKRSISVGVDNNIVEWSPDGTRVYSPGWLVEMPSQILLGQYSVPGIPVAAGWDVSGDRYLVAQLNGIIMIQDAHLANGFFRTITPVSQVVTQGSGKE